MKKLILSLATLAAVAAFSSAQTLVFDNVSNARNGVSGAGLSSTGSTPNTFMGGAYNLAAGTTSITGLDIYPVNGTAGNFDHLKINFFIWGAVNTSGTINATTPAFSNLLGSFSTTSTGTFTSGFYFPFENAVPGSAAGVNLATPLAITGTQIGITFNYQGSTDGGVTYSSVNSLTSMISYGTPATVGSNVFDGYFRNGNSETNGNFTSGPRSFGQTNQSVAVRVYGNVSSVPEPASLAVMGLGVLGLAVRRRRSSK